MLLLKQSEQLCFLDELIRKESTGSAIALAKRLNLSKSSVKLLISNLRDLGVIIEWDETRKTYYYSSPESIKIQPPIVITIPLSSKSTSGQGF